VARIPHTLAVDLGGTNMRVAVVHDDGTIVDRLHAPTPHGTPDTGPFLDLVREVRGRHRVEHAVIAVPGRVDHRDGLLLHAPNLPDGWAAQVTRTRLEAALDVDVDLVNDADAAAVGEAYFGAGRGHADVVYVTISTGVGAGILVGGRLVLPRCSGGEIGHSIVEASAAWRGELAEVEQLGSGTAINRLAHEAGLDAEGRELARLVERGDPRARAVWTAAMHAVGIGVVNLVHFVGPSCIVVGGGVGRNGSLVLDPLRDAIARFGPVGPAPEVVPAALGDDPGLIGAAAWRTATEPTRREACSA
jgi:predicted NBD/HSP70 family sugar kinase